MSRKLILMMHVSLDGFVAGPNGEMDWIQVSEEMFESVGRFTDGADAVLYGRVTYQMMEGYWPTAGQEPGASAHDIQHSAWVNAALKIVASTTLKESDWHPNIIIGEDVGGQIRKIKQEKGRDILLIGSPRLAHSLMREDLFDEYFLCVNPVILGEGIPLFEQAERNKIDLQLLDVKTFEKGVAALHYERKRK